ncbi:hypothetical protein [Streptomyces sp. 6N223]|uniref:hypothetical protein n=1 Tax=Streptomyces sp. 6N223 TaxID=3457412 RepID=UPI003FD27C1E
MQTRKRTRTRTKSAAVAALVALVAVLLPVIGGGATASAAPGTGSGASSTPVLGHWRNHHPGDNVEDDGWLSRMEAAEAAYGDFEGHWRNYHAPEDALPMTDQEIAVAERGQPLHISWKPRPAGEDWAYTASGAYDDTIDQVMTDLKNHCGPDCWLSIEIEPEATVVESPDSGFTTADFRGLWQRVADSRERVGADNVELVWVLGGFEDWRPLYASLWPGNDVVDVIGHDPYVRRDEAPERLAEKMLSRTQWLVDNSTAQQDYASKPFLIAEFGCDLGGTPDARGTDEHRAACIEGVQGVLDELAALGVVELEFFDARTNWINDPPAVDGQAYQALKAATEAG